MSDPDAGVIPGIRPLGVSVFGIVEPAGEPCDDCGERPGEPHACLMDFAYHRHGMTHLPREAGRLLSWLCQPCYEAWFERIGPNERRGG